MPSGPATTREHSAVARTDHCERRERQPVQHWWQGSGDGPARSTSGKRIMLHLKTPTREKSSPLKWSSPSDCHFGRLQSEEGICFLFGLGKELVEFLRHPLRQFVA